MDIIRGLAIIGVVIYHFMFDLRLVGFITLDVTTAPIWVAFARILSGTFLTLVGVGLVFSHLGGINWQRFWRRFAIIFISAIAISIATYFAFAQMFVYFGILHAIAIFSLLALPFLRAPIWLVFITAIFIFTLPFWYSSPLFNERVFSFIGLWQIPPITGDLVPIFPSFALTLFGVIIARLLIKFNLIERLSQIVLRGKLSKFLAKAGRLSLIIYLIHQPILLGILMPVANFIKPNELTQQQAFYGNCFGNCLEVNASANYCKSYCQCSLEQIEQNDYWQIINSPFLTSEQNELITSISNLCSAMNK